MWLSALLLAGCGYRVASQNRLSPDISSLAVITLENSTSSFAAEQILTRALVEEFVAKTGYRVLREQAGADAVMRGNITRLRANPVTFGSGSFGSTFQITLVASLELTEVVTGRTLFRNDRFLFREQYVISADPENFFNEANPALDRIARDFARSVVSSVLEGF